MTILKNGFKTSESFEVRKCTQGNCKNVGVKTVQTRFGPDIRCERHLILSGQENPFNATYRIPRISFKKKSF